MNVDFGWCFDGVNMRYVVAVWLCFFSSVCFSGTAGHTGTISKAMFFTNNWSNYSENDDGVMVFYMNPSLPAACGEYDGRIAIGQKHPLYQSVVASVLAAKMAGTEVSVKYITSCTKRHNAWDFGYLSIQ